MSESRGPKNSPLRSTMIAIMHAPECPDCKGTGLTLDELHECEACCGYGRGAGLFRKMIERVSAQTKAERARRDEQAPASFKIENYRAEGVRDG